MDGYNIIDNFHLTLMILFTKQIISEHQMCPRHYSGCWRIVVIKKTRPCLWRSYNALEEYWQENHNRKLFQTCTCVLGKKGRQSANSERIWESEGEKGMGWDEAGMQAESSEDTLERIKQLFCLAYR